MSAESRPIKGPMGRGARGPKPNIKDANKTIKDLCHTSDTINFQFILVIFLYNHQRLCKRKSFDVYTDCHRRLCNAYAFASGSADFTSSAVAISSYGGNIFIGIAASYLYNRTMVSISQGVLKEARDDMFAHMQTLPIK